MNHGPKLNDVWLVSAKLNIVYLR